MDRYHHILKDISEAAQKTFKGTKRSDLKDSDFLFPETRSFPIVSPQDVPDAISNFGRMKDKMSYDDFLKKLYNMAKKKGPEFVAALPSTTKEKLGIKTTSSCYNDQPDLIMSENPQKLEYNNMIEEDEYEDEEEEEESQEELEEKENEEPEDEIEMEIEKIEKEIELELLKQKLVEIKKSKGQDFSNIENMEKETVEQEMMEYKNDFYEMSVGSIKSIMQHAKNIIDALEQPSVKENLTESFLQGKIAITEDYMIMIHNFVMFSSASADKEGTALSKTGLWENIRKKKERMGKNYKAAKPGDKDRPNPDAWKKAQK